MLIIYTPRLDDHLHFEDMAPGENLSMNGAWTAGGRAFSLSRVAPFRRILGKDGGLDPAPVVNTPTVIRDIGLIQNSNDTSSTDTQHFPQLSAENPGDTARFSPASNSDVYNDTWVVWGNVEAWAEAHDPEIKGAQEYEDTGYGSSM